MSKKNKDQERITIFGEEIFENHGYDAGNFIWGFLLIIGGSILLLNTLGIVPWSLWDNVWHFWPILIILWGLQIVVGKGFLGSALVSLITIFFLIFVALFAVSQTNPDLVQFLPEALEPIFENMKGVTQ